jgi:hypothetical protein
MRDEILSGVPTQTQVARGFTASMERDEEREPDAKHHERDQEMAVGEDGPGLVGKALHSTQRHHKDAA